MSGNGIVCCKKGVWGARPSNLVGGVNVGVRGGSSYMGTPVWVDGGCYTCCWCIGNMVSYPNTCGGDQVVSAKHTRVDMAGLWCWVGVVCCPLGTSKKGQKGKKEEGKQLCVQCALQAAATQLC